MFRLLSQNDAEDFHIFALNNLVMIELQNSRKQILSLDLASY